MSDLQRLRIIGDTLVDFAVLTLDFDGVITTWSVGAEALYGYRAEECVGRNFDVLFTQEDRDSGVPRHELENAVSQGYGQNTQWQLRKDGTRVFVSGATRPIVEHGRPTALLKIAKDLTDWKRLTDELSSVNQELEDRVRVRTRELFEMSMRMITVQEEERHAIARELHDDLGQRLVVLQLKLASAERLLHDAAAAQKTLASAQQLASQVSHAIHAFARELRSSVRDVGLVPALADLADSSAKAYSMAVEFEPIGLEQERFPRAVEVNLYRIAQEAVHNAFKHAQATRVDVLLQKRGDALILTVADNGRGIDANAPSSRLGLVGMRERAAILGGRLHIESSEGAGTAIIATVPTTSR